MVEVSGVNNLKQKTGYPAQEKIDIKIPIGFQVENIIEGNSVVVTSLVHNNSFYESLMRYSRILKIMSVIESLACLLFLIGDMNFLLFLIPLPLLGYCSARYFNKNFISAYLVYLVSIIAARSALIGISKDISYKIIQGLLILIDMFVLSICIKFFKMISQLNSIERHALRMAGIGYIVPSDVSRIEE